MQTFFSKYLYTIFDQCWESMDAVHRLYAMTYAILYNELQPQILVSEEGIGTKPPGILRGNLNFGEVKKVYADILTAQGSALLTPVVQRSTVINSFEGLLCNG